MTEGTEMVTLDLNEASKQIREKIKLAFVEMIPDEQWENMLKAEWQLFVESKEIKGQYGRPDETQPSEFSGICQEVLRDALKDRLKEILLDPECKVLPETNTVSQVVMKYLDEHKDELMTMAMRAVMGSVMQSIVNELPRAFPILDPNNRNIGY